MRRFIKIFIIMLILIGGVSLAFYKLLPSNNKKYNIVFIMIDTLRADHLGCYGYQRDTSPTIDSIANKGILFKNSFSASPWTIPTIVTLFTGYHPNSVFEPANLRQAMRWILPNNINTLPEMFQQNGYETYAIVDHPAINPIHGHARGFDRFIQASDLWEKESRNKMVLTGVSREDMFQLFSKDVLENIDESDKNFFLYLHLIYPHGPYERHTSELNDLSINVETDNIIDLYDSEIRYTDRLIEKIYDNFDKKELLNDTYFVITSDHGEGFMDHNFEKHGNSLYNELLRVPLIILPPKSLSIPPSVIESPVGTIDLFSSLLELAFNKNMSNGKEGKSLPDMINEDMGDDERIVFSESPNLRIIRAIAAIGNSFKYIYGDGEKGELLFDLDNDPEELNDVQTEHPETVQLLRDAIIKHKIENRKIRESFTVELKDNTKETLNKLRSLGYVQ